jgi:excisionase family DNA binding protein
MVKELVRDFYNKKEAAKFLGMSEKEVERMVVYGKLQYFKLEGLRRFTEKHLNDFMEKRRKIE